MVVRVAPSGEAMAVAAGEIFVMVLPVIRTFEIKESLSAPVKMRTLVSRMAVGAGVEGLCAWVGRVGERERCEDEEDGCDACCGGRMIFVVLKKCHTRSPE